ncbi:MAG: proteasome assembly chaperone family protein [Thermoplasmatota archaeon]
MELLRFVEHHVPKQAKDLVFIEGLPGVGNVGKLATEHLVDVLGAKLWADVFGHDFPPQVTIEEDGTVRLVRCQLWFAKGGAGKRDLAFLTGDFQPLSSHGQYELVTQVLARLAALGCKELYTLGGYGLGVAVEEPGVLGAATDDKMMARLEKLGIAKPEEEPGGGIIGASGLFLGLGQMDGLHGACLMGETSGYLVDPRSARAVLGKLGELLGTTFETEDLEAKADDIDHVARQLQEGPGPGGAAGRGSGPEGDMHYIG